MSKRFCRKLAFVLAAVLILTSVSSLPLATYALENEAGEMAVEAVEIENQNEEPREVPVEALTEESEMPKAGEVLLEDPENTEVSGNTSAEPVGERLPVLNPDSKVLYWNLSDLKVEGRWGETAPVEGRVTFPGEYKEYVISVPTPVKFSDIIAVSLITSENEGSLAIKLYNEESVVGRSIDEATVEYGRTGTGSLYAKLDGGSGILYNVGYMSHVTPSDGGQYPFSATVTGLQIEVKSDAIVPAEPEPVEEFTGERIDYSFDVTPKAFFERWNKSYVGHNLEFDSRYKEFVYDLKDEYSIKNIAIYFSTANSSQVAFKFYNQAEFAANNPTGNKVRYGNKDKSSYTFSFGEGEKVRYIGIMATEDSDDPNDPNSNLYLNNQFSVDVSGIWVNLKVEHEIPNMPEGTYWSKCIDKPLFKNPVENMSDYNGYFSGQEELFFYDLGQCTDLKSIGFIASSYYEPDEFAVLAFSESDYIQYRIRHDTWDKNTYQKRYLNGEPVIFLDNLKDKNGKELKNIRYIAIKSEMGHSDEFTRERPPYTIDKLLINTKEVEETLHFTPATDDWMAYGGNTAHVDDKLCFTGQYAQQMLKIGRDIEVEDIKSVTYNLSEANTKVLSFKFWSSETAAETSQSNEVDVVYGKAGSKSYTYTPTGNGTAKAFGIMANNNDVSEEDPLLVKVESIDLVINATPLELRPSTEVDTTLEPLYKALTRVLDDDDFIVGTAISSAEFADAKEMQLVKQHFNGVTLGNELKPDSILGNYDPSKIGSMNLNGETIEFPALDFSTPNRFLDNIYDANQKGVANLKVRGHVLVWHSQTPDWFFREDYDTSKDYVTPDVMNKRLECYIKSVAGYYFSAESKYKGMFYGWDVVNEAISDSTGTFRSDSENSTWWKVYGSDEFIRNAFVYANKYFPENISLFYNDYNAYQPAKCNGICELVTNVKNTPGSRINGVGMQGHYFNADNNPTMEAVKKAALRYAELVDEIQFTEVDFKQSTGTEDPQLAKRYVDLFNTVRRLRDNGVNVTGFTVWGVTDKHSWLQSQNNVGGGADGSSKQYPLLFDGNYQAKLPYYELCELSELPPEEKVVYAASDDTMDYGLFEEYEFLTGNGKLKLIPYWVDGEEDETSLNIIWKAGNGALEEGDSISFFFYDGDEKKFDESCNTVYINAEDFPKGIDTAEATFASMMLSPEDLVSGKVSFDVVVTKKDGTKYAFADTDFNQATSSKYCAKVMVKSLYKIVGGTPDITKLSKDSAWEKAEEMPMLLKSSESVEAMAVSKVLWDKDYLYVLTKVTDPCLNKDSADDYQQDSIEVFIDENNAKTESYEADDKQYRINYENYQSFNGQKCVPENVESYVEITNDGYEVAAKFKWTDITAKEGTMIGFDVQVNDANQTGSRLGTLNWIDGSGNGYTNTSKFGTLLLTKEAKPSGGGSGSGSGSQGGSTNVTTPSNTTNANTEANAVTAVPGRVATGTRIATPTVEEPEVEIEEEPTALSDTANEDNKASEEAKNTDDSEKENGETEIEDEEPALIGSAKKNPFPIIPVVGGIIILAVGGSLGALAIRRKNNSQE